MPHLPNNSLAQCIDATNPVGFETPESLPPILICAAGDAAKFAWQEFIFGEIRNPSTRRVYRAAIERFLTWCEERELALVRIAPAHVGYYLDELPLAATTKKLHLAALRHFFDRLVLRHVVILNPAASVRGEKVQVIEGKTPEIKPDQVHRLLAAVDTSHVVGLRDRAIIAVLVYTAARVGAVAKLRIGDFYDAGDQHYFRFTEKGQKHREIPVRHDLQVLLLKYKEVASLPGGDQSSSLFRSTVRRTRQLTTIGMTANDISRMVKRRLKDAGLPARLSPHSFRVATLTNLLEQNISLEDVQLLAGHADPRTTRLYDRRHRQITRNIVERISI